MAGRGEFFVTEGTLSQGAACYVVRQADQDLLDALSRGEFAYVLDSRQKGKSSLMIRAREALEATGTRTVLLDLQRFGSNLDPDRWYASMLQVVGEQLDIEDRLFEIWDAQVHAGPMRKFFAALETGLGELGVPCVVFVDEIDFVRSHPFSTDEFFAGIRECLNRRASGPQSRFLTFCLLGVATPSELIRDVRITPFNVGKRIELTDFTLAELVPYEAPLSEGDRNGAALLKRIHHWTAGHPYLTQKLASAVSADSSVKNAGGVDRLVEHLFFSLKARSEEPNLADVSRRVLESPIEGIAPDEARARVLDLYRQVRDSRVRDDETDPVVAVLKLSGLTRVLEGYLVVRNRVYFRAFDKSWVEANLPEAEAVRVKRAERRAAWRTTAVAITAIGGAICIPLAVFALSAAHDAQSRARGESRARSTAQREAANAKHAQDLAESASARALAEQARANLEAQGSKRTASQFEQALAKLSQEKQRVQELAGLNLVAKRQAELRGSRAIRAKEEALAAKQRLSTLLHELQAPFESYLADLLKRSLDELPEKVTRSYTRNVGEAVQLDFVGIGSDLLRNHDQGNKEDPLVAKRRAEVALSMRRSNLRTEIASFLNSLPKIVSEETLHTIIDSATLQRNLSLEAAARVFLAVFLTTKNAKVPAESEFKAAEKLFSKLTPSIAQRVGTLRLVLMSAWFGSQGTMTTVGGGIREHVSSAITLSNVGNYEQAVRHVRAAVQLVDELDATQLPLYAPLIVNGVGSFLPDMPMDSTLTTNIIDALLSMGKWAGNSSELATIERLVGALILKHNPMSAQGMELLRSSLKRSRLKDELGRTAELTLAFHDLAFGRNLEEAAEALTSNWKYLMADAQFTKPQFIKVLNLLGPRRELLSVAETIVRDSESVDQFGTHWLWAGMLSLASNANVAGYDLGARELVHRLRTPKAGSGEEWYILRALTLLDQCAYLLTQSILTLVEKIVRDAGLPLTDERRGWPAIVEFRMGRYAEALSSLIYAAKSGFSPRERVFLAMAQVKMGQAQEANSTLIELEKWCNAKEEGHERTNLEKETWDTQMELKLLMAEARSLLMKSCMSRSAEMTRPPSREPENLPLEISCRRSLSASGSMAQNWQGNLTP